MKGVILSAKFALSTKFKIPATLRIAFSRLEPLKIKII